MKRILILMVLMCLSYIGFSQTAVYFCTETGAVGYSIGYANPKYIAYSICMNNGGVTPMLVTCSYDSGYGAIAIGYNLDGGRVIGVALSFSSKVEAERAARAQCINSGGYNVYIHESFYDSVQYKQF